MKKMTDYVLDREGNAVAGAEVYVKIQSSGALASLFSDDGITPTSNPLTTDNDGEFSFYAADNEYKIQVFIEGVQQQEVNHVLHYDASAFGMTLIDDADAATALTTLGISAFAQTILDDADAATARTTLVLGSSAVLDTATATHVRANTADKVLLTDDTWSAADYVALTDAATIAVDLSAGINFSLTIGGNRTLDAPSNTKNGQSGEIIITQDGTGSRTLAYHANWKFAGGSDPVLSTAAGTVDVLSYKVVNSTFIIASLSKAFA